MCAYSYCSWARLRWGRPLDPSANPSVITRCRSEWCACERVPQQRFRKVDSGRVWRRPSCVCVCIGMWSDDSSPTRPRSPPPPRAATVRRPSTDNGVVVLLSLSRSAGYRVSKTIYRCCCTCSIVEDFRRVVPARRRFFLENAFFIDIYSHNRNRRRLDIWRSFSPMFDSLCNLHSEWIRWQILGDGRAPAILDKLRQLALGELHSYYYGSVRDSFYLLRNSKSSSLKHPNSDNWSPF